MRSFISILFILLTLSFFVATDAEAKRFGGGRSFAMQRSTNSYSSTKPQSMQPASPASGMSRWLGPIAGLAMGGLLAYLLMNNGISSGILAWLVIGGIILLIINFMRNRKQAVTQSSQYNAYRESMMRDHNTAPQQQQTASAATQANYASSTYNNQNIHYPVGFNPEEFLRDAKINFMRLQTAYDKKNLADLCEFTTPEVFAEIQMQIQERSNKDNHTEVVTLDAQLLEAVNEFQVMIASVRFSGMVREDYAEAASFNEIWHFRQDVMSHRWLVAGLQQQNL